jgi:hypothetical protein
MKHNAKANKLKGQRSKKTVDSKQLVIYRGSIWDFDKLYPSIQNSRAWTYSARVLTNANIGKPNVEPRRYILPNDRESVALAH